MLAFERDLSGEIEWDLFWEINVVFDEGDYDMRHEWAKEKGVRCVGNPHHLWPEGEYGAMLDGFRPSDPVHACPLDPSHETSSREFPGPLGIRGDMDDNGSFVCVMLSSQLFVYKEFARKLDRAGFRGLKLEPLELYQEQLEVPDDYRLPHLFEIDASQSLLERPYQLNGIPNRCPSCGLEPLFCPGCGQDRSSCRGCGVSHAQSFGEDRVPGGHGNDPVLNGATWRGEDFCAVRSSVFVTRRVVRWLRAVDAFPFVCVNVPTWVGGMSTEQRGWMKTALTTLPPSSIRDD
ncbi:MAG: hypothetical protein U1D30_00290 [Planctomycetota bacterium]